jgi:16S rRNA (cytidine1402-2'-O)-methyltransferase
MEKIPGRRPPKGQNTQPEAGLLYLVATPIGNLEDLSFHALEVLKGVDGIACEDTRHSRPLLDHYGIDRPLIALNEHNEDRISKGLVDRLLAGDSLALISDAGTPLINDPGFPLVRAARAKGIVIRPIPGPCALIAALSASGLASHRFAFEGFPPRKSAARLSLFESLKEDPRTLIFYESSHRVLETLVDVAKIFEADRRVVIARELTKRFETILETTAGDAEALVLEASNMQRGEFVLLIEGSAPRRHEDTLSKEQERILNILLQALSVKTAAAMTAEITGARRETLYREALRIRGETGA